MKILIVDDEPLARERIREMLKRHGGGITITEAGNGCEAVERITNEVPDIVFLDVQMPDLTGFQVLETLGRESVSQIPALIFVTAFEQYAVQAFEHSAVDYLLKPFDRSRFAAAFERAKEQIAVRDSSGNRVLKLLEQLSRKKNYLEWLTIRKDERILLFRTSDIQWIEACGNYVKLKLADSSQLMRGTINSISERLDPKMFVRIHRSTIVNINHVRELQAWGKGEYRVVTKTGHTFTLSRGYRDAFDAFLHNRTI